MRTNVDKTVSMVCHPCQGAGNLSEAAYGRRVTGEGPTYRERLKGRVSCRECGYLMVVGSLEIHLMTKHGRVAEPRRRFITPAARAGPRTFRMTFPAKGGPQSCPVEGCLGPSGDKDGNAGALTAPACPQHCVNSGGGKPPPSTVRPMQHSGPPGTLDCGRVPAVQGPPGDQNVASGALWVGEVSLLQN